MNLNLIIFFVSFCAILSINIFINIFKKKISLKYSLVWFSYIILMIISLLFPPITKFLTKILGFELMSNMIFFFGFSILILICFAMTKSISKEKEKVAVLTQELAILKKEMKEQNEKNI